jgi:hypothetical protein
VLLVLVELPPKKLLLLGDGVDGTVRVSNDVVEVVLDFLEKGLNLDDFVGVGGGGATSTFDELLPAPTLAAIASLMIVNFIIE